MKWANIPTVGSLGNCSLFMVNAKPFLCHWTCSIKICNKKRLSRHETTISFYNIFLFLSFILLIAHNTHTIVCFVHLTSVALQFVYFHIPLHQLKSQITDSSHTNYQASANMYHPTNDRYFARMTNPDNLSVLLPKYSCNPLFFLYDSRLLFYQWLDTYSPNYSFFSNFFIISGVISSTPRLFSLT